MRKPTEYADFCFTTGVYVAGGEQVSRISQLFRQVEAVDSMLQRLREAKYAQHESVFEVDVDDAAAQIGGECLLPDQKLSLIDGVNTAQWEHTYQGVLYDRERGWDGDPRPDGRLDWQTALETFRDTNTADPFVVEWDTTNVTPVDVDGRPAVDCPLGNGDEIRLFTAADISDLLGKVDEIRLTGYPEKTRQVIGELTTREAPEELELTLGYDGRPPRHYVDREGLDSEKAHRHASQLETCCGLDVETSDSPMGVLAAVVDGGYFPTDEQIRYGLFLAGARDVIRVTYGYSVPTLIDKFAAVMNADVTHLPQTGEVLVSREPLDEFEYLAEFPNKQELTADEERAVRAHLDRPETAIEFNLGDATWGVRATEKVAQLFAADVVSVDDVYAYQFAGYSPKPTENHVFEAIRRGRENLEALRGLDVDYDVDLGQSIEAHVEEFGYVSWCN